MPSRRRSTPTPPAEAVVLRELVLTPVVEAGDQLLFLDNAEI
jgi:hypothetical protein